MQCATFKECRRDFPSLTAQHAAMASRWENLDMSGIYVHCHRHDCMRYEASLGWHAISIVFRSSMWFFALAHHR